MNYSVPKGPCDGLNVCVPEIHVKILTPKVMVLEVGPMRWIRS